uniref:ProAM N-terminal 20 peptide n=1 Tax=Scophthalmus maximus TaxID=52904 RepID=A0A8D3B004_SCOMX
MEITVLLLLTVPLTVASPFRPTHRSGANTVLSGDSVQASGVKRSEVTQEEYVPALKIIPFHSEDKPLDLDALKHNMAVRLRPRRTPQRGGCQLGTCQVHNLANTLFILSKTNGKDVSKTANDPQGYGR